MKDIVKYINERCVCAQRMHVCVQRMHVCARRCSFMNMCILVCVSLSDNETLFRFAADGVSR